MAKFKVAPLSGSFMVTAIVGFLVSMLFVFKMSATWGVTFMIFFAVMLIAALISMTKAPVSEKEFK
jgi:hypothetical protein